MDLIVKKKRFPLSLVLTWRKQTNSPRIKMLTKKNKRLSLMEKNKRLSQKLIMLNNIEHTLPPLSKKSEIVNTYITSMENRNETVKKYTNQGLLQYLIDLIKMCELKKIPKLIELVIPKDNLDVSVLIELNSSIESVTTEQKRILSRNKSNETPHLSILREDPIR